MTTCTTSVRVPKEDILDIKALDIERQTKQTCRTATEIYESIPTIAPTITSMVTPVDEDLGQYKVVPMEEYAKILFWDWFNLIRFDTNGFEAS